MQATDLATRRARAAAAEAAAAADGTADPAAVSPAALAQDLVAVAKRMFKESGHEYYDLVGNLDLTITQIKALHWLENRDSELSVKDLAEVLALSLPATSRNVEALLQRGLLERREDERDRRVRLVRITASGRDISARLGAARLAGMERLAASMTEQQRRRLRDALAPILERPDSGTPPPWNPPAAA